MMRNSKSGWDSKLFNGFTQVYSYNFIIIFLLWKYHNRSVIFFTGGIRMYNKSVTKIGICRGE